MRAVFLVLMALALISLLFGVGLHQGCTFLEFLGASARACMDFAATLTLLAIAVGVGKMAFCCCGGEKDEPEDPSDSSTGSFVEVSSPAPTAARTVTIRVSTWLSSDQLELLADNVTVYVPEMVQMWLTDWPEVV